MTIANNDLARTFLFPNGVAACNVRPIYGDCFSVDGLTQDGGDVTDIECPDPLQYGKFKKIGFTRGQVGRVTTTLQRHMTLEDLAILRSIFDGGCPVDVHFHWGLCTDPTAFNQYMQAWILEEVVPTSWSTDPLIALTSGDRAPVNESLDISATNFYQIKAELNYSKRAATLTTVPILSITICSNKSCGGDACPPASGCDKVYALDNVGDILVSLDSGGTWIKVNIPAVTGTPAPLDVVCLGPSVAIFYADGTIGYLPRNDLDRNVTTAWVALPTAVPTVALATIIMANSIATLSGPMAIVGESDGSIYQVDDQFNVTLLDNTSASGVQVNAATAKDDLILYVGNAGLVMVQRPGSNLVSKVLTAPTAVNLFAAVVKTRNNWIVAGAGGEMWCTNDGGCTWDQISGSAIGVDTITDMCANNRHVIWASAGGSIYRSIDGGSTWVLEPNGSTSCRVAAASLGDVTKLGCCVFDHNRIIGVGTAGVGAGLIAIGE